VQLTIQPVGSTATRVVKVVRGQIDPPTVEYRMLPNHIGYVQVYGFPQNAASQVRGALDALDRQGARAWIFDARDNGGGAIDAVTQVLSMFAPRGTELFYSYDASGNRTDYKADGTERNHLLPSVVLTNDGTGSGGEVFAAVMREVGVARVVGTQTAGCVGTGEMFSLSDGSGLQVTVAQLITGRGKTLNQVGVTPDVPVDMTVDDLVHGRDPQLQRAIDLVQAGK
jgi:carboxyl-terminal processing protease